jgi:hypothetical protein
LSGERADHQSTEMPQIAMTAKGVATWNELYTYIKARYSGQQRRPPTKLAETARVRTRFDAP